MKQKSVEEDWRVMTINKISEFLHQRCEAQSCILCSAEAETICHLFTIYLFTNIDLNNVHGLECTLFWGC